MPSREEKARRKEIKKQLYENERSDFIAHLPVSTDVFRQLFDHLDEELGKQDCNHDYKITRQFLASKQVSEEKIFKWFQENGGYCDCEILYNIEDTF